MSLNEELHAELKLGYTLDDTELSTLDTLYSMHQDKKEAVKRLYTLAFNRGYNSKNQLTVFNYDTLLSSVEEITEALYLVHNWLNCCPEDDEKARISLIHEHSSHFAVFNMILNNLNSLLDEHSRI